MYDTIVFFFVNFFSDIIMHSCGVIMHSCGVIGIIFVSCVIIFVIVVIYNIPVLVSKYNPFVFFAGNSELMHHIYYLFWHGQHHPVFS